MVVEQGVLVVGIADQMHQHLPQAITTVKVHVAGLCELSGGALEQQNEVLAALHTK